MVKSFFLICRFCITIIPDGPARALSPSSESYGRCLHEMGRPIFSSGAQHVLWVFSPFVGPLFIRCHVLPISFGAIALQAFPVLRGKPHRPIAIEKPAAILIISSSWVGPARRGARWYAHFQEP
ncbi:hypothetical protein C8R44DRAFT_803042 [Mycena epipterygia]|nr:hypothetical protein C8R44DRAFT_803042 [Mycena epipterygia]